MSDFFSFKHSFNSGDLLTLLPGIRHLYKTTGKKSKVFQRLDLPAFYYEGAAHSIVNSEGQGVCMNLEMHTKLKPLIDAQEYIESFEIFNGETCDYDIDLTRADKFVPMPAGLIHHYPVALYPQLGCDLGESWIDGKSELSPSKFIIVNRTERYQNPYITYFFLNKYQDRVLFSGTNKEYEVFCNQWKLNIPQLESHDFLELAKILASSKGFLGNQSFLWHLCDSQHIPRILELNAVFPNTFPTGKNGYAFYRQAALEYYFEKLINQ